MNFFAKHKYVVGMAAFFLVLLLLTFVIPIQSYSVFDETPDGTDEDYCRGVKITANIRSAPIEKTRFHLLLGEKSAYEKTISEAKEIGQVCNPYPEPRYRLYL